MIVDEKNSRQARSEVYPIGVLGWIVRKQCSKHLRKIYADDGFKLTKILSEVEAMAKNATSEILNGLKVSLDTFEVGELPQEDVLKAIEDALAAYSEFNCLGNILEKMRLNIVLYKRANELRGQLKALTNDKSPSFFGSNVPLTGENANEISKLKSEIRGTEQKIGALESEIAILEENRLKLFGAKSEKFDAKDNSDNANPDLSQGEGAELSQSKRQRTSYQ